MAAFVFFVDFKYGGHFCCLISLAAINPDRLFILDVYLGQDEVRGRHKHDQKIIKKSLFGPHVRAAYISCRLARLDDRMNIDLAFFFGGDTSVIDQVEVRNSK